METDIDKRPDIITPGTKPAKPLSQGEIEALKRQKKADSQKEAAQKAEDAKEALKIRCRLNRPARLAEIKQTLAEYYGVKDLSVLERMQYIEAINLPSQYRENLDFFNDERLAGTMVVIVPDELWVKGEQPSESMAEKDMIIFKKSYFEGRDEIAWMTHELAHCLKQKNAPEKYESDSQTYAFPDLGGEYPYPNNKVEAYTFSRQFLFLKQKGISRNDILQMIKKDYEEKDMPFFNRLLDQIY